MKTFTLRCGSGMIDTRVDDWDLSVYGDEMEMSCKIVRRDRPLRWYEMRSGVMMFKDSEGRLHEGKYIDWWWRARVPLHEATTGIRYWPHELNEGNEQNMSTFEVEPKQLGHYPLIDQPEPELVIEMPEVATITSEEIEEIVLVEDEPEPEGVVTPFAVLGDEDDRPIEEVVKEFKEIIEEAVEAKPELVIDPVPLHAGSANTPSQEFTGGPSEAEPEPPTDEEVHEAFIDKQMPEESTEEPLEPEILSCPICGVTTTKSGKPFKSELSVKRHVAAAHKTRDTE